GARRLSEEKQPTRSQHTVEFGDRAILIDEMVKCLVTEDDVGRCARQRKPRAVGVDQLDRATALCNLCGRECQHAGIHVDADHVAWTEMALENGEGSPGAA